VIGEHKGLVHHTIGQRKGIGIARKEPLYVLNLDMAGNRLMVGSRADATAREAIADGVTMIAGTWPIGEFSCDAVVRYRGVPTPAIAHVSAAGEASVRFITEQPIASPGQAIVFYRGDEVLGGGTIRQVVRTTETVAEPAQVSLVR